MAEHANITRRKLLKAAPALTLTASMPSAAVASDDPLPGYLQAFYAAEAAFCEAGLLPEGGNGDSPACLAAEADMDRMTELLCTTVATSRDGLLAQIAFVKEQFDDYIISCVPGALTDNLWRSLAEAVRRVA